MAMWNELKQVWRVRLVLDAALVVLLGWIGGHAAGSAAPALSGRSLPVPVWRSLPPDDDGKGGAAATPRALRRIVRVFDFDEPDNPYPVPRHWIRAQDGPGNARPGFPRYNEPAFDHELAHSGTTSVRLPARGGSTCLRLVPGVLPVFPHGDYAISAFIQTQNLQAAHAFLTARFLDQNQRPIPGQEVRSAPMVSEGAWTPVTVELLGFHDQVAFLQIELEVLQPRQQRERENATQLPRHHVEQEDLDGAAWFDDVGVYQLPRIELDTTTPGNVVRRPQQPVVRFIVRDMVGEQLRAHLKVTDIDGQTADEVTMQLNAAGRAMEWTPALPSLGWYRVEMDVVGEVRTLTSARTSLVWLPAEAGIAVGSDSTPVVGTAAEQSLASELSRFGIMADRAEAWQGPSIINIVRTLGTGHITLPIWGENVTLHSMQSGAEEMAPTLDQLLRLNQQVRLCLPNLPTELAIKHGLEATDALSMGLIDQKEWLPFLNPALDRYGQRITHWQVGQVAAADSLPGEGGDEPFWSRGLGAAVPRVRESLSSLVPGPVVGIPWRADLSLETIAEVGRKGSKGAVPDSVAMVVPYWVTREAIEQLRRSWDTLGVPVSELVLVPQARPADQFGERSAAASIAGQIIELWRMFASEPRTEDDGGTQGRATRFAVNMPWESYGTTRQHVSPTPELAVWNTLAKRLQGRRIVGEYPAPRGVRCYILSVPGSTPDAYPSGASGDAGTAGEANYGGALVAWNESSEPEAAVVHVYGNPQQVSLVDPFGNAESAVRYADSAGTLNIPVTETPVFMEGVDDKLAMLIASFRVEPPVALAMAAEHEHVLVLSNPWDGSLSGQIQIVPPSKRARDGAAADPGTSGVNRRTWTIVPDGIITFSIPAGQTQSIPFAITIPAWEEAGDKQLVVLLRLDSEISRVPIKLYGRLHVGLDDLELTPRVELSPEVTGPDVVVSAAIRNSGAGDRVLRMQVTAPGFPTREIVITHPEPGETINKKMVFKDAAAVLQGKRIRISVGDAESPQRLNTSVVVP